MKSGWPRIPYVTKDGFELLIFLPLPPEFRASWCVHHAWIIPIFFKVIFKFSFDEIPILKLCLFLSFI